MCQFIKDMNEELLRCKEEVRSGWRGYFDDLNFKDGRKAELSFNVG